MSVPAPEVRLVEITRANYAAVLALNVAPTQAGLVATNAHSLAQAHFHAEAWPRAVATGPVADDATGASFIGFVMLDLAPEPGQIYLWRLMIDAGRQRCGFGTAALKEVVTHVRTLPGIARLGVSFVEREGGPEAFYTRLGFVRTGRVFDGEPEMALDL